MKGRILTENQIAAFATYLKSEEKSENTIEKYIRDVRAFSAYVGKAEITKETVIAYKNKLVSDNYAVRSINSMVASLNGLFSRMGGCESKVHKTPKTNLLSRRKGIDQSGVYATCKYSQAKRQRTS